MYQYVLHCVHVYKRSRYLLFVVRNIWKNICLLYLCLVYYVGSLNWFAKYLDVLLYLCAVFLCKVLIFFVQTAFVFILMGLLQPKRTKLCCNLLFLISNRNSFHRLSHFSQGKNSFLLKTFKFYQFVNSSTMPTALHVCHFFLGYYEQPYLHHPNTIVEFTLFTCGFPPSSS